MNETGSGIPDEPASGAAVLDEFFEVSVKPERVALLIKASCISASRMPTLEEVKDKLYSLGVCSGIDDEKISSVLGSRLFNVMEAVATASAPKVSTDAKIEEMVKLSVNAMPELLPDGRVDYRKLGNIVQVKAGDILAVKTPAVTGESGWDVFGNEIHAIPGRDAFLPCGKNTRIEDNFLVAEKPGFLYRSGGQICIGETYEVHGDVNFKCGNIDFEGDVVVRGGVGEGFTVEAGGDITVMGEVDGASLISRRGSITVKGGVFGREKGRIQAKKEVRLTMVQQCAIHCGFLKVSKSLLQCNVETWGLDTSAKECVTAGGRILCYGSADVGIIGLEGVRTEFQVLDEKDEAFRAEVRRLEKKEDAIKNELGTAEKKVRNFQSMTQKLGAQKLPPKIGSEMAAAQETLQEIRRKLHNIQVEKEMIRMEVKKAGVSPFVFRIREKVAWGVHLDMFHHVRQLGPESSGREFRLGPDYELIDCAISRH